MDLKTVLPEEIAPVTPALQFSVEIPFGEAVGGGTSAEEPSGVSAFAARLLTLRPEGVPFNSLFEWASRLLRMFASQAGER